MLFYRNLSDSLKKAFIDLQYSCLTKQTHSYIYLRKENGSRDLSISQTQETQQRSSVKEEGKRAWIFSFPASLTAEAAIALPVLLFAMYLLIFPMRVMEAERRLQNRMETAAKQLTLAGYIEKAGKSVLKLDNDYKETLEKVLDGAEEGAAMAYVLTTPGIQALDCVTFNEKTAIMSGEEGADPSMVHLEVDYRPAWPMTCFSFLTAPKTMTAHRRAWTGSAGGRGRDQYGVPLEEEEGEEDRMVYLGRTSTVYHDDPRCHYLSNDLMSADASQMGDLRNTGGARYHACPSCKPGSAGTVYYSASGTAYHSSESCKAITAYARAVHYHEVEGMRACSYCGKH